MRTVTPLVSTLAVVLLAGMPVAAQTTAQGTAEKTAPAAEAKPSEGILPVPDYTGDIWTRSYLTGDWNGSRTELANKGLQISLNSNTIMQSVVKGGTAPGTAVAEKLDLNINLDLMKMGVLPGALVKFRAQSRWGETVNGTAGSLIPVNTDDLYPLTKPGDESVPFTIIDLTYYQFLSEHFGVFYGKIDLMSGDPNEFASGRGVGQFLNLNFVFNPVVALTTPLVTLGGGVVWLPNKNIQISSLIVNTSDSSTTTGFNDVGDGWTSATEADFQYRLGTLPGGQNVGFTYAWNNNFRDIGRLTFVPGEGLTEPEHDYTWAVYWSAWQYLYTKTTKEGPMDMTNDVQDLQGIGLFARAGTGDQDTNPFEYTLSVGLGGRGMIPGRDNDTFGVGYYYFKLQTSRFLNAVGVADYAYGLEGYYNVAVTPATHLTFDIQTVDSARPNVDTAVILGMRLAVQF